MRDKSVEDFIEILELSKRELFDIDLESIISDTFSFVERIWSAGQKLDEFTDHGIGHSYEALKNALDIADKITVSHSLNDLEKTILAVACLIHDIGMQCKKYDKWRNLEANNIRSSHCSIGFEMFEIVLEKKKSDLPNLAIREEGAEKSLIFEKAMYVAFSHCSRDKTAQKLWRKLTNDEVKGEKRRLKLLAGLLRLGDELDMCFDRIMEINRLASSTLSAESKAHWACCYYIKNVKIESGANGKGSMRVRIDWRAPKDKEQIDKIRKLITEKRIQHFNQEVNLIKPYLKEADSSPEPILEEIKELGNPEESEHLITLPKEVEDYLVKELYPYTFSQKTMEVPQNLIEINESSFGKAKSISDDFIRLGKGVIPAHYVLKTGFHTDKYIKCRDLICNNDFTIALVKALKEKFSEFKPTRVVSIGTTAIRIGSLLSILFEVPFSYAVGEVEILLDKFTSIKNFNHYEKMTFISKQDRLLIIDDILGMGTVFEKIMSQLKKLEIPEDNVVFFYIYSLGHNKKFVENYRKVKIYFLNAYPDINYWQQESDGSCKYCKDQPEIRNYE